METWSRIKQEGTGDRNAYDLAFICGVSLFVDFVNFFGVF